MKQLFKDTVFPSRVGLHILWLIIFSVVCSQGLWMLSQKSDIFVVCGIIELFVVAVGTIVTIQSLFRLIKAHLLKEGAKDEKGNCSYADVNDVNDAGSVHKD